MRAFVLFLGLAACFSPVPPAGAPCGPTGACPSGLVCSGGLCQTTVGDDASTDAVVDADLDAPPFDAMGDAPVDAAPVAAMWQAGPALPSPRSFACAIAFEGRLYAIGGSFEGTLMADVVSATIAANGMLGAWTPQLKLPIATRWHACAVHPATRSIFVVGGDEGSTGSQLVWRSTVALDGTLGTWIAQASLPEGRRGHAAEVVGDTLYVLGGEEHDGFAVRSTVYVSTIDSTGFLAQWSTTVPLLEADYEFGTAVSGTHLLMTGGYIGSTIVRTAEVSPGALSTFTATTALPSPQERHVTVTLDGWLYAIAGEKHEAPMRLTVARRAQITSQGTVGAWQPLPPLPNGLAYSGGAAANGHVYVVGGSDESTARASVYILTPPSP